MIPISYIRENQDKVVARLAKRGAKYLDILDEVLELDIARRKTQQDRDEHQSKANDLAKQIGDCFKKGDQEKGDLLKTQTSKLKEDIKNLDENLKYLEHKLKENLSSIPNIPDVSVPAGNSDKDNIVERTWGVPAHTNDSFLCHWDLAEKYELIDFEVGVKITGAGFPLYKGKGARLQRALINFFLDKAIKEGYLEVQPPIMINEASGFGTGQLPDKEGQMYFVEKDNMYLIPTAEVPVTNIYRNSIVEESDLPIKMTAYTPCFRREAGSYGKHVRGLNRLHQFDKVEIVQIQTPDKSYETLENMCHYVSGLLEQLGLHHRVLKLCAGDLGFASACTYDMEVYSAAQKRWLEVSSVSNFEYYQSNRLQLRYRSSKTKKKQLAHTLNGSALALPRVVAAILENNQTQKGIKVPEVLVPYTGFEYIS
jgi:seryl-tRNA synthetase